MNKDMNIRDPRHIGLVIVMFAAGALAGCLPLVLLPPIKPAQAYPTTVKHIYIERPSLETKAAPL